MIPDECASIRSIARCVLPVLVGPNTAVTPAPRARSSRSALGENEIDIEGPAGAVATAIKTVLLYHNVTPGKPCACWESPCACWESPVLNVWNESGTNRGRIGDSASVRVRSLRYMAPSASFHTRCGENRHRGGLSRRHKPQCGGQT